MVGKKVEVIQANNKSLDGLQGTIVDETRETLVIHTQKGEKRIPKKGVVFAIGKKTVSGDKIVGRSEERLKK